MSTLFFWVMPLSEDPSAKRREDSRGRLPPQLYRHRHNSTMPYTASEAGYRRQRGTFVCPSASRLRSITRRGILGTSEICNDRVALPRGRVLTLFPCCGCLSAPGPRQAI